MTYFSFPGLGWEDPKFVQVLVQHRHFAATTEVVAELTGITLEQMQRKTKEHTVSMARGLVAHLLVDIGGHPVKAVSEFLYPMRAYDKKLRDNRGTVYKLLRSHQDLCDTNPIYNAITKQAHHLYERPETERASAHATDKP